MPTAAYLAQFPSFPANLPLYDVPKLSYTRLHKKRSAECKSLLHCATEYGMFLLDLGSSKTGQQLVHDVETAFAIGKDFFDSDLAEKKEHMGPHRSFGYKPVGLSKANGKPDLTERFSLSRDTLLKADERLPKILIDRRQFLLRINFRLQAVAMMILTLLERQLSLPKSSLRMFHDPSHSSGTVLRFLHNVRNSEGKGDESSMHAHKDYGSITILFNVLGGLQVLPPGQKNEAANWRWIKPDPSHAIVIIGDTLVDLTNGDVRSMYHRVVDPPGEQSQAERYSFGYFLRPNDIPRDVARTSRQMSASTARSG